MLFCKDATIRIVALIYNFIFYVIKHFLIFPFWTQQLDVKSKFLPPVVPRFERHNYQHMVTSTEQYLCYVHSSFLFSLMGKNVF